MRLISAAAFKYASSRVGDNACSSAMLSKLALIVSSGSHFDDIDVDVQQLLDRAAVFGTVEAGERALARIGVRQGVRIDPGFERADQTRERRFVGTTRSRRRHHSRLQLDDHPLGNRRRVGGLRDVERLQRQTHHIVFALVVVASDTGPANHRVVIRLMQAWWWRVS